MRSKSSTNFTGERLYEEYERGINNLRKQYEGELEEFLEENNSAKTGKQQFQPYIEIG